MKKSHLWSIALILVFSACSKEQNEQNPDLEKKSVSELTVSSVSYEYPSLFPNFAYSCETAFANESMLRIAVTVDHWGTTDWIANRYNYPFYVWRRPVGSTVNYEEATYRVCGCTSPTASNCGSGGTSPYLYFEMPPPTGPGSYEYYIRFGLNGGNDANNSAQFIIP